jgi:hypothetical protein
MYQFKSTYTVYIHITHIKLCLLRAIFKRYSQLQLLHIYK